MMSSYPVHFEKTADQTEALSKSQLLRPDLVIADVESPEADGYELAKCFRQSEMRPLCDHAPDAAGVAKQNPKPKHVAFTAQALKDQRQRCLDAGFDDVLAKSLRQEALARLLVP